MLIGRLNHPESNLSPTRRFLRRGTNISLEPDIQIASGDAFGWSWTTLMDVGVDIAFSWPTENYIGAVCLKLADGAAVQAAEVWCGSGDDLRCCGRHDARTGESCGGAIDIAVGVTASQVVVRLRPLLTDVVLEQLDVIGAALSDEPLVYPTPRQCRLTGGSLDRQRVSLIVRGDSGPDTAFAATHLQQRMSEVFSQALPIGTAGLQPADQATIILRLDPAGEPESYAIEVSEQSVQLTGSCRIALLYACDTLVQLATSGAIPLGQVRDRPYKRMRGFHFGLPPRESFDFYRRLLRHVLLPLRYNTLFIEFAGGMRFDRHPEISQAWLQANQAASRGDWPAFPHGDMVAGGGLLEKDEVRELVAYAKSLGFTVIPEVQSLSHVQYITCAHPEIAEVAAEQVRTGALDTRAADQPPSTFYHHSSCPSHETSYTIICDIIDEIVEVVQPERYVHMGHDEVYQLALCPRCKGQDPAELFARHVLRLYAYLKQKGLGMMIWSDMLQPTERYRTHPAIDRLPRDIVLLDFIWYFHLDLDMEDHLLPHGFEVVMGNLYSSHYPRYASRAAKPGMTGGEVSTWCRLDEYTLAKKGKLFDLMYSAEMLWSDRYLESARPVYAEIIQRRIPDLREALRGRPGLRRDRRRVTPLSVVPPLHDGLPGALRLWLADRSGPEPAGLGDAHYPAGAFDCSGAQRLTGRPLDIPVGGCFDRLAFLHAASDAAVRQAWVPLSQIGVYSVRYADGRTLDIPVEYAGNIWHWARRYGDPLRHPYYRHQGYAATYMADPAVQAKTETGKDILLLAYEWVNPSPDCPIAAISCRSAGTPGVDVLLMAVSGVSVPKP